MASFARRNTAISNDCNFLRHMNAAICQLLKYSDCNQVACCEYRIEVLTTFKQTSGAVAPSYNSFECRFRLAHQRRETAIMRVDWQFDQRRVNRCILGVVNRDG